jgi:pyruvate formate lyase activating enzyme
MLADDGHDIQVRVPCIPGINDSADQVRDTSRLVADAGIKRIALLPYNSAAGAKYDWIGTPYELAESTTQTAEYMQGLADICRAAGLEVQVGG